jgi:hypothetical protein
MPSDKQPDFDEEFDQSVAEWRDRHRLREDDAVILLVELFRIHQRHWDDIRRSEFPSYEEFRSDMKHLLEATGALQMPLATMLESLRNGPAAHQHPQVSRAAAVFAAIACLLAGYLIGKAWP